MQGGATFSQNDTFGSTGAFLSGTMTKMKKMARRQGGQWCLCACPPSPFLFLPSLRAVFWHGNRRLTKPRGERTGMVFLGIVMTVFFWTWLLRR